MCAVCILQNIDINELCVEFTKNARCDGTKVVLDPEGMEAVLSSLSGLPQVPVYVLSSGFSADWTGYPPPSAIVPPS